MGPMLSQRSGMERDLQLALQMQGGTMQGGAMQGGAQACARGPPPHCSGRGGQSSVIYLDDWMAGGDGKSSKHQRKASPHRGIWPSTSSRLRMITSTNSLTSTSGIDTAS